MYGGGERIGAEIGEVLDVEAKADGRVVGKFLRIKVRMNIKVPLMRGFILDDGKGGNIGVVEQDRSGWKKE